MAEEIGLVNLNALKLVRKKDVYQHVLATLLLDKHGLASKKATKDFVKQLDDIKPDVIGLHNIHGYYLNYEILFDYIKANDIPVYGRFTIAGHLPVIVLISIQ